MAKSLSQKVTLLEESLPEITSFVVRFVHSGPPIGPNVGAGLRPAPTPAPTRGSILNVQTNQELPFLRWEEAVAFMRRFVILPGENDPPPVGGGSQTHPYTT